MTGSVVLAQATQIHEFVVNPEDAGLRLDVFLTVCGLPLSRSQLRNRIDEGLVLVDGGTGRPSQRLRPGQAVQLTLPPPRPSVDQPEAIPLDVRHEDAHLLVVNKPAGLVVHPAPGHESGTLVNALLYHCGALPTPPVWSPPAADLGGDDAQGTDAQGADADADLDDDIPVAPVTALAALSIGGERRPGIVHRLDQGTSGLLVCAKDEPTLVGLQVQFQAHSIDRRYLAVVLDEGGLLPASGTFRTRYGRHPHDRRRFTGRGGTRDAVTHYQVIERLGPAALVQVRLETGRTHQIRVHLSEAGFPLIGDLVYGERPRALLVQRLHQAIGHQALHAELLGFVHPRSGQRLLFSATPPDDFAHLLSALRQLGPRT